MSLLLRDVAGRALAALGLLAPVPCQTLVKDIRPGTLTASEHGSAPRLFTSLGSSLCFVADDGRTGEEVWISDGTAVGTRRLADVRPGPSGSLPTGLCEFGTRLLFCADDGTHGPEPWISDGTEAGTHLLSDLLPGSSGRQVAFVAAGAAFYMVALDLVPNGTLVWKSDGTAAGTVFVGGFPITDGVAPRLVALGDRLVFTAGWELWVSDGTSAGSFRLVVMAQTPPIFRPAFVHAFGNLVLFEAEDPALGNELWRTDGTVAGTNLVADLAQGASGTSFGGAVVALGALFFGASDRGSTGGGDLWRSDGTAAGTRRVKTFPAGSTWDPLPLAEVGGKVLLAATDPATGTEPWVSDGTPAGTQLLLDVAPGAVSGYDGSSTARLAAGRVVFAANDVSHGREPWITDGTPTGTRLVADVEPGTGNGTLLPMAAFGNLAVFATQTTAYGNEPWISDGTTLGTRLLADVRPAPPASSAAHDLVRLGDRLFFTADEGVHGAEPWTSDGTPAGTHMVVDTVPGIAAPGISAMAGLGDRIVLFAALGTFRRWLVGWDGSAHGFQVLPDPAGGAITPLLVPSAFVCDGGTAFYGWTGPSTLRSLWRTDGTVAGTIQLQSSATRTLVPLFAAGGRLWFTSSNASVTELWVGDGTAPGSTFLRAFPTTTSPSSPRELTPLGATVGFLAFDQGRWDLWSSDGTPAGTNAVTDASFGSLGDVMAATSGAPHLATWNGRLFLASRLSSSVDRLWSSDGTRAGTVAVRDFAGLLEPLFTPLTAGVLFAASEAASGRELWCSDGTTAGTALAREIQPGPGGGLADTTAITAIGVGTRALLAANDGTHGIEAWSTDGRAVGSFADLAPGAASSLPERFVRIGDRVLFLADDGSTGQELYSVPVTLFGGAFVDEVGPGCPGHVGLAPRLGARGVPRIGEPNFGFVLDRARPSAPLAWLLHATSSVVPLFGGCTSYVTLPPLVIERTTDALGTGNLDLAIPPSPELVGVDVYVQGLVLDPAGAWGGVLAFSNGLRAHVGG